MKNQLFFLLLIIFAFSCNKVDLSQGNQAASQLTEPLTATTATATGHIGDPNRTPNLYIPQHEKGWLGYTYFGLYDGSFRLQTASDGTIDLAYPCHIANGKKDSAQFLDIDYSGKSDFVVCKPCDGIQTQYSGSYDFPGMLSIMLFKDGKVVGEKIKQTFDIYSMGEVDGYNWRAGQHYYGADTMYLFPGTWDEYFNKIKVPSVSGVAVPGKYVVRVEINPDKLITESNYKDNTSFLPVSISGTTVTLDTSALSLQMPQPAQWIEYKLLKGKVKGVSLKWSNTQCQNYCIEKNGVMIKVWYNDTTYVDPTGHRGDTYRIRSNNWGLGNVFNNPVIVAR
jgi:hypothetical protein